VGEVVLDGWGKMKEGGPIGGPPADPWEGLEGSSGLLSALLVVRPPWSSGSNRRTLVVPVGRTGITVDIRHGLY
jgi:hypothetical protein